MNQTELAQLREERELAVEEMKSLSQGWESGKEEVEEEVVRFEQLDEKQQELAKQIAVLERSERVKSLIGSKKSNNFGAPQIRVKREATAEDRNNAFKAWAFSTDYARKNIKDDWKRSADLCDVDFEHREYIERAQSTDAAGTGYGDDFVNGSIHIGHQNARKAFGGMFEAGEVRTVSTAEPQHYSLSDDTAAVAQTHAQNADVTQAAIGTDKLTITPTTYSSGVWPVAIQMIRDSRVGVGEWISENLSRRLLYKANIDATAVLNAGATVGTYGYSDYLSKQDMYDLVQSVDPYHRQGGKTRFMSADATRFNLVNRLEATDGTPLWGNGLNSPLIQQMFGTEWVINQQCQTMSPGVQKKVVFYGDFSRFKIHTVSATPTLVRSNDLYMGKLAVGFILYWELGFGLVDPGDNPIKYLETGTQSGDAGYSEE